MVRAPNPSRSEAAAGGAEEGNESSSAEPPPRPYEGFKYVQSLADNRQSGGAASLEAVALWGCTALVGSATATGTLTAWARSRTKVERNLPPGTHTRAAFTAFKALGVASAFTGCSTAAILGVAYALGVDSAAALRRGLRGATRGAIAATGADTLRSARR